MKQGIVTKVIAKGFGFIRSKEVKNDLYFHASSCVCGCVFDDLKEGQKVAFEVKENDRGLYAVGVMFDES